MSCPPHTTALRRKNAVGGGSVFVNQCLVCGEQVGGSVALRRIEDPRNVPRFDKRLAHRPNPTARKREYAARFKRADWKKLRMRVLERDCFTCQDCGEAATEVAHLTYERFGAESLSDLAASCSTCNLREREQRITAHVLGT